MKLLCVLRLIGTKLDDRAITEVMKPIEYYRLDRAGEGKASSDCLYIDVAEGDTKGELLEGLTRFLSQHEPSLLRLSADPTIMERNLDIGLIVDEEQMSMSLDLDERLIAQVHKLNLSVSIAFYKSSREGTLH